MGSYEDGDFKRLLRTDKATFEEIVATLSPLLHKSDTNFRKAKTVGKRTAIGLWHYAHGGTYLLTGDKFGVSEALAHRIVREFIDAMIAKYSHKVSFPSGDALHQVIKGFESLRQFPNCFGAIDCTHILISTPCIADYKGYFDRNKQRSVILQAVVDSQGRFLDVYAGQPGSVNDSRVFAHSDMSDYLHQGKLSEPVVEISGYNIRPYLVGDAGYKLEKFCIIPYPNNELEDPLKERLNFWQSSTRIIVEQAFGRLKGRFRWLNGRVTIHNPMDHARIINVGCILHHIMMDSDCRYNVQWAEGVRLRIVNRVRLDRDHTMHAAEVRNVLAEYVYSRNSS